MRKLGYVAAAALALGCFVVAYPKSTSAAPDTPTKVLTVSPSSEKPTIEPGKQARGTFQIINQGQQTYTVKVYSAPYSVLGEAYTPDFKALPGKPNVADWLQFTTAASKVKPGQTIDIGYTITVPAGTQPGGYYAVAFTETRTNQTKQGVVINERVGEIFYITVAGKVQQTGRLVEWSSAFWQQPPLSSRLRLENSGGVHYGSDITVTVSDVFGRAKYTLRTQKQILPQTVRSVPVTWDKAPPLGLFKVSGRVTTPGKSQQLSTKYVLVMSPMVRLVLGSTLALVVAFALGRTAVRQRAKLKQKGDKSP